MLNVGLLEGVKVRKCESENVKKGAGRRRDLEEGILSVKAGEVGNPIKAIL